MSEQQSREEIVLIWHGYKKILYLISNEYQNFFFYVYVSNQVINVCVCVCVCYSVCVLFCVYLSVFNAKITF